MDNVTDDEAAMRALFAGVEWDEPEVEDLRSLELHQVMRRLNATIAELKQRRELLSPHSDRGRELHSLRTSYLYELNRRTVQ
jgi:hypothetical protein